MQEEATGGVVLVLQNGPCELRWVGVQRESLEGEGGEGLVTR